MKRSTLLANAPKQEREASILEEYGQPPINIFTRLRKSAGPNHTAVTHDVLARMIGISKQALIRLEQGTFASPLPAVVDYYVNRGYNELVLMDNYEEYQMSMRNRNRYFFGDTLSIVNTAGPEHPLRQLRSVHNWNPTEVSKSLCLPQATLEHFEKKWRSQKTVPKSLIDVLIQIGYTHREVKQFCTDYHTWRTKKLGR